MLGLLEMACDPMQHADLGAIVMQEGLANVCLVTSAMTLVRAKIETNIPRKRKGQCSQHDKVLNNKSCVHILQQNQQFTYKQTIDQSQLSDRVRNWRRMEMASIQKINYTTLWMLGNLPSVKGNFVATKMLDFAACLTSALVCLIVASAQMLQYCLLLIWFH